jgi:hypothetical protein
VKKSEKGVEKVENQAQKLAVRGVLAKKHFIFQNQHKI